MAWTKKLIIKDEDNIDSLLLSKDQRLLLALYKFEYFAKVWDIEKGEEVALFNLGNNIQDAVIAPSGDFALIAASGVYVCKFKDSTAEPITFPQNIRGLSVDIAADSRHAVVAENSGIYLWDLEEDNLIRSIKREKGLSYTSAAISPNHKFLAATVNNNPLIYVWSVEKKSKPKILKGHKDVPMQLVFLDDSQTLVSFAEDSEMIFWDVKSRGIIQKKPSRTGFTVSSDGEYLAERKEWHAWLFNRDFDVIKDFKADGYVYDLALESGGKRLYMAIGIGTVFRWSLDEPEDPDIISQINAGDWLEGAAHYFINLDFFAELSSKNEIDAVAKVISLFQERYSDSPYDLTNPSPINLIRLIALDDDRIWWGDSECIYHDNAYTELLDQWARISRGAFNPSNITEVWDEGPAVSLSFNLEGASHSLQPDFNLDYIDEKIIPKINQLISQTGFEFYVLDEPRDQTMVILCLTEEERHKLEGDLGLTFNDFAWIQE
jgi:hypothetical protein